MQYSFLRFPDFKTKAVTLSYDDGVYSDKRLIEILDKYHLKCTFNLNSERFAKQTGEHRLTAKEAIELYSQGVHEIAAHGADHLPLADVADAMVIRDVLKDKENLEKLFGRIVKGMAYAYGSCDERVAEIVNHCGLGYARTIVSTGRFDIPQDWLLMPATCHHDDPRLNELIDLFLAPPKSSRFRDNTPKLFYLWGHSYEFDNNNNWDVIENFAQKVGLRDDVFYATNGELYDYVKAFDSLQASVDGKIIYNPTCIDVYISNLGQNVLIKAGQTVCLK